MEELSVQDSEYEHSISVQSSKFTFNLILKLFLVYSMTSPAHFISTYNVLVFNCSVNIAN